MKYIKKVTLENFQSHKYSIIELNEQMNVIVGPSDSGKSAIIRGIKWALYNEPAGDYFIKEGEKDCRVTLEFNDNTILERYRSKSRNSYTLINKNGVEMKFEGFGSNIPTEIIDSIGIKKIYLDSDESNSINLGEQLDGAFLLSEKTSTRASAIGRLVGVNIIDDALREVLKDTRKLNISKKGLEESSTKLDNELRSYDHLDSLKIKINKLIELKSIIENKQNKLEIIINNKSRLTEITKDIYDTSHIVDALKIVDKLNELINIIDNKTLKYKYLNNFNINLIKINSGIIENTIISSKLSDINRSYEKISKIEVLNDSYCKLNILQKKYNLYLNEKSSLYIVLSKLDSLDNVSNDLNEIKNKYTRLIKLEHNILKYKNINDSINIGKKYIKSFSGLEIIESSARILESKSYLLSNLNKIYITMLTNRKDKQKELNSIIRINATIKDHLNDYQELLRKFEICPFCLSEIDEHKIEHIISHYIGG